MSEFIVFETVGEKYMDDQSRLIRNTVSASDIRQKILLKSYQECKAGQLVAVK